jgi:hypothetical protein
MLEERNAVVCTLLREPQQPSRGFRLRTSAIIISLHLQKGRQLVLCTHVREHQPHLKPSSRGVLLCYSAMTHLHLSHVGEDDVDKHIFSFILL